MIPARQGWPQASPPKRKGAKVRGCEGARVRGIYNSKVTDSTDPTVLWRFTRSRSTAHATIFPSEGKATLTWFFDGVMDRAENYESVDIAMARADQIRGILLRDGWTEVA